MMTLIIDGNYFAQRVRNAADLNFIVDPAKDRINLFQACATSLALEIRNFQGIIDSVFICRDWSNWRKKLTPVYPLETEVTEDRQVYKVNRDFDKDYDASAFYSAFDEFCTLVDQKLNIPMLKTPLAEADDFVYLVSKALGIQNKQSICWSSDGDYIQNVSKDVFLVKFPKRELYTILKDEPEQQKDMFSVFNKAIPQLSVQLLEQFDKNVKRVNPIWSLFMKVVHGDSKDNVPPLFFWKGKLPNKKTGKYTIFKPAAGHITKALKSLNLLPTTITENHLYDKEFIKQFIIELLRITKQTRDIDHTLKVYDSSLKMKHLSTKQIPVDIVKSMISVFNENRTRKPNITNCSDYQKILAAINVVEQDSYFKSFNLPTNN